MIYMLDTNIFDLFHEKSTASSGRKGCSTYAPRSTCNEGCLNILLIKIEKIK